MEFLRKPKGKHIIWLMGGGELAREFLSDDLVDDLYLGIVPTLIGEGIPLFPSGFPQREFSLLENKTYGKGMIAPSTSVPTASQIKIVSRWPIPAFDP